MKRHDSFSAALVIFVLTTSLFAQHIVRSDSMNSLLRPMNPGPNLTFDRSKPGFLYVFWGTGFLGVNSIIINNGTSNAAGFRVGFYLSRDNNLTASDILILSASISDPFIPDETQNINLKSNHLDDYRGYWYVGMIIDYENSVAEDNENDNSWCLVHTFPILPDLIALDVTIIDQEGPDISFKMTVNNRGIVPTDGSKIKTRIYLSTDKQITTADYLINDWNFTDVLTPGMSKTSYDLTSTVNNVPAGEYYLGVITDAERVITESLEDNNTDYDHHSKVFIGAPDITLSPDSLTAYNTAILQLHIGNRGHSDLTFSIDEHNLLNNGGFENGFVSWVEEDHLNAGVMEPDSSQCRNGKYSLKAKVDFQVEGYQFQLKQNDFQVYDDHIYILSFWGMAEKTKELQTVICKETANWEQLSEYCPITLTANWQFFKISMKVNIPEGIPNPLPPQETRFSIQGIGLNTIPMWLDDIKLQNPEEYSGWLNFGICSGVVNPGDEKVIDVVLESQDLSNGTYLADICIQSNDPDEPAITIPIKMIVNSTRVEQSEDQSIPHVYTLFQNYPNPFNSSTVIVYAVPEPCFVTLTIHDLLGRKVITMVKENRTPGVYSVTWDGQDDPNGIYICHLHAGGFTKTKKIILQK